jgi:hypothetical protein
MLMLIHHHYLSASLGRGHVVNGMATLFRVTLDEAEVFPHFATMTTARPFAAICSIIICI